MGADLSEPFLDSMSWFQRFAVPLMTSRYFPDWPDAQSEDFHAFVRLYGERLADTLPRYLGSAPRPSTWGWKFCETLFLMPVIASIFPHARFVHIVRDGRDVSLSDDGYFQLTGFQTNPPRWEVPALRAEDRSEPLTNNGPYYPTFREFCMALSFGDPRTKSWNGLDLSDRRCLIENRYLLQMQSWVHCVTRARQYGLRLHDRYRVVRYEDVCRNPIDEARSLLRWMEVPMTMEGEVYLRETVTERSIKKWRRVRLTRREARDFDNAIGLAAPILKQLDYVGA